MFFNSVSRGLTISLSESSGDIPGKTTETYTKGTSISGSASFGIDIKVRVPIVMRISIKKTVVFLAAIM